MTFLQAVLIGILEGLTEFLPVSSTGHMILATALMGIQNTDFVKTFEIVIQLGAILAVVVLYFKRFTTGFRIYTKLFAAFLPTAIIGFFAYRYIKQYLFTPIVVTVALIVGGIVLILIDRWTETRTSRYEGLADISIPDAIKIGFFQSLSMIPGTSRSAASIIGGIYAGFDRTLANEFSFLLAVPTMFAASALDLVRSRGNIHSAELPILATGFVVAFISALFAMKGFIAWIQKHGFKHFGYYRIALGILFLILCWKLGINLRP